MWATGDISFELIADLTDDPVVTLAVGTPDGVLMFAAEPWALGTTLVLRGTHVQFAGPATAIGAANLMVIAQVVMERMGFDGLVVEGALRTTGANPGRRPRVLRFTRRLRPAAS
jgi:hypothetical protein